MVKSEIVLLASGVIGQSCLMRAQKQSLDVILADSSVNTFPIKNYNDTMVTMPDYLRPVSQYDLIKQRELKQEINKYKKERATFARLKKKRKK